MQVIARKRRGRKESRREEREGKGGKSCARPKKWGRNLGKGEGQRGVLSEG